MFTFQNEHVSCTISVLPNRVLLIRGSVKSPQRYQTMQLLAAHPIQRMTSYSGSGLPFPCPNMALHNTPNQYTIHSEGEFTTHFSYPNAYYTNDNLQKIPPSVFVILTPADGSEPVISQFKLPEEEPLSLRTLTHRTRRVEGPHFYHAKEAILGVPLTAEHTMRAYKDYKIQYNYA